VTHPLTIVIGGFITLTVFSYLARDNPIYRIVQNAALGISIGIGLVIVWKQVLQPLWLVPVYEGLKGAGDWRGSLWVLALIPGSLWYFQLSKKWFWISTLISGLFIGTAVGIAFQMQILLVLPQIKASLKLMSPWAGPNGFTWDNLLISIQNVIFIVGLLTTLLYFFFSVKTGSVILRAPMRVGRVMIMVALGAMFGSTVMTRMAYLLERLGFLRENWAPTLWGKLTDLAGWVASLFGS